MIIHPSVIAAAEQRKPLGATETPRPGRIASVDGLPAPGAGVAAAFVGDATLARRTANLAFAGARPSTTELERLLGANDLIDEFYLERALVAARPVMRITLRDAAGRERGWATGFMVSPSLMLTNWHVFQSVEESSNAVAEAHYVLDIAGNPALSYRFMVRGDRFYLADQGLDFALVAVDGVAQDGRTTLPEFGYHRLIDEPNKILRGESITLIQHPGGERRQFAIRANELTDILDQFLWYQSDTAPGSSGAPAFNDSFQVVALHHAGAAKRDEQGRYVLRDGSTVPSIDDVDDSRVVWVANEGLRISVLCAFLRAHLPAGEPLAHELLGAMEGGDVVSSVVGGKAPAPVSKTVSPPLAAERNALTIPLRIQVSLAVDGAAPSGAVSPEGVASGATLQMTAAGVETLRYPIIDRDYTGRAGYDSRFLGIAVPLPRVTDLNLVSRMADGRHEIPYEHFTVVLNKTRRMALFTVANADYSAKQRRPEVGDYTRSALTGLGPHDIEKWATDPRIPQQDQLPDVFYTQDGQSFDKGHVVRREDMCWGDSRAQIVRANGDTYHVTNCSPQASGFNRSVLGIDNWGDLEDEVQAQAKTERLSILAGPILAVDDKVFDGRDEIGPVRIQIPRRFWKVVLSSAGGSLAAYAFVLQQDLHDVPLEFRVTETWSKYFVSLAFLEKQLIGFRFPQKVRAAERYSAGGHELAKAIGVAIHPSLNGVPAAPEGTLSAR